MTLNSIQKSKNPDNNWDLRFALGLLLLFLSLALRLVYLYQASFDPIFDMTILDEESYDQTALCLLEGNWLLQGEGPFFQDPLYPYFLAVIYMIFGHNIIIVKVIQALLSTLTVYFLYRTLIRLSSMGIAFVGGLLAALMPTFIYYNGFLLKTSLSLFLLSLALLLLYEAAHTMRFLQLLLTGVAFGLFTMTRGNFMLIIPFIFLWLWWYSKSFGKAFIFGIGVLLALTPVTARNYYIGGEFVLITSQAGQNFYIGNNPWSDGASGRPPFLRKTPRFERQDFKNVAEKRAGRALSDKQVSAYWMKQGKRFIIENPKTALKLFWRKFLLLAGHKEVPDNYDFSFYQRYSMLLSNPLINWSTMFILGGIGLFAAGNWRLLSPLRISVIIYALTLVIFHVYSRYRQPLTLLLIILAALGIEWMFMQAVQGKVAKLLFALLVASVLAVLTLNDAAQYNHARSFYNIGYGLAKKGEVKDSIIYYQKALKIDPDYTEALNNLGAQYRKLGDWESARDAWEKAVEIDPNFQEGLNNLGTYWAQAGDLKKAENYFIRAVDANPNYFKALYNLGSLYLKHGRYRSAAERLAQASFIEKDNPKVYYNLALAYEQISAFQAIYYWDQYLEVAPRTSKEMPYIQEAKKRIETLHNQLKSKEAIDEDTSSSTQ